MDDLPEEIRNHIVSFLPMKEAIRTSILSKKWKNVCSSLSNLRFEPSYSEENIPLISLEQFLEIVYQTLGQHDETDINKFQLNVNPFHQNPDDLIPHINEWISFAVSHNVQQLDLFGQNLPFCLVSCYSLTVMSLSSMNLIMSTNIRLPNLITLDLFSVTFYDVGVTNQLFSSCPALESLTISYCFWTISFDVLYISSPSLKVFTLRCHECFQEIDFSTKNLRKLFYEGRLSPNLKTEIISSLDEAEFSFFHMSVMDLLVKARDNHWGSDLLMGLHNVVKLSLRTLYLEVLTREQDLLVRLPTECCTLKHLHLDLCPTKNHVQVLMFLLRSYPNLQTLTVFIEMEDENPFISCLPIMEQSWKTQELNTDGMLKQLRRAEYKSFGGSGYELDLVRFLLENADVMEEMNINLSQRIQTDAAKSLALKETIQMFARVSPYAAISFS